MKPQERVDLVNEIAYKLQEEMQLIDIKNYLFAFGIKCQEHTASFNSKRVFVQENLATIENDIIFNIAKDLKLINIQDLSIETLINRIYKICMEKTNIGVYGNYLPFYENVQPKTLAHLFAYFHFAFNSSFDYMNLKLYWN